MKKLLFLLFLISFNVCSQEDLYHLLKRYNNENVPYITVDRLKDSFTDFILLDAREKKEFNVSHIKNAFYVGYEKFNLKKTIKNLPNKNAKIIVYCSLGIRSENIAEKLKKVGYTGVFNLYGGIFEWKNKGNIVFDSKGKATEKVHACNQEWSKWLLKGVKIYE